MGQAPSHQRARRGTLSQVKTNGLSILGTLAAPLLPAFLTDNPLPNGYPWSKLNTQTNYYTEQSSSGVTRFYDLVISRGVIAPDGVPRNVLLVNGAFPAPPIEANWLDTIQVTLHNNITGPEEGTALHWHGFLQTGTPWEDGVPAVSQCPIAPGKSFTYNFKAQLYGSTWYHSHYSAQYSGGIAGPMIIYGPQDDKAHYDVDVGPVMLSDWYHTDYLKLVEKTMSRVDGDNIFFSDNNLINGKMNFDCSTIKDGTPCQSDAPLSKFKFKRGKTHLLRLMNVGSEGLQRFSIDGHKMTVISNDFVDIQPYETEVVTLGIGQRSNVLVKADGDLDAYWMRSNISQPCSLSSKTASNALAAIYYDDAETNKPPHSTAWDVPDPATCGNDDIALTKPLKPLRLPEADKTYNLEISTHKNESNVFLWTIDNVDFRGNYNSPTLLLSNLGNTTFEKEWNVKNTGNAKSVRVIIFNNSPAAHPMHLHGFNMYILHTGPGQWDGKTIINPDNPARRDVIQLPSQHHLVMQFDAEGNPGVWPFHCHIAWHVSAGLFTQFLTAPEKVEKMHVPKVVAETCRQWGTWTNTNIPDQIDSGL